jgi:hypothetical protein
MNSDSNSERAPTHTHTHANWNFLVFPDAVRVLNSYYAIDTK